MKLKATVVRVNEVFSHPNADHLEIIHVRGQQTVVGQGEFRPGHLATWIPAGLTVPEAPEYGFLWPGFYTGRGTRNGLGLRVPEEYRTIHPRRFRGEWSVGLLMPLRQVADHIAAITYAKGWPDGYGHKLWYVMLGQDVTRLLGITNPRPYADFNPDEFCGRLANVYMRGFEAGFVEGKDYGREETIESENTAIIRMLEQLRPEAN